MTFSRKTGPKADARAELHIYANNQCKLELALPAADAQRILAQAVSGVGTVTAQLVIGGTSVPATLVGGRIDSLAPDGSRIGGTGVIEFAALVVTP